MLREPRVQRGLVAFTPPRGGGWVTLSGLFLVACGPSSSPPPAPSGSIASTVASPSPSLAPGSASPSAAPSASAPASSAPSAAAAPSASAPPSTAFVRGPQFVLPIDHCVFDTGGPSCMQALREEKDGMTRRFMLHIVEARAAQAAERLARTHQLEIPHPEQASFCKTDGPCGGKRDDGAELDSAYDCLTRASLALGSDPVESSRFHARACRCHGKTFEIPVQGGTGLLGCDHGKLVQWGKALTVAQAGDVELCSQCDPVAGPAACDREIARLRDVDPELSRYIADVHVARCQTPP